MRLMPTWAGSMKDPRLTFWASNRNHFAYLVSPQACRGSTCWPFQREKLAEVKQGFEEIKYILGNKLTETVDLSHEVFDVKCGRQIIRVLFDYSMKRSLSKRKCQLWKQIYQQSTKWFCPLSTRAKLNLIPEWGILSITTVSLRQMKQFMAWRRQK